MKIGMCMFLWTTSVSKKHEALLKDIKATGFDGVEIPVFVGAPDDYRKLGEMLDRIGLERTAVSAMGDPAMNLISPDAGTRKAGVDYKVVKNTLVKIALKGTPLADALKGQLKGQTGIAFSFEEPSAGAKVVKEFRKVEANAAKLQVKCGVLENAVMAGARVETELASLPGKNEVRAMLLAQLMAPMQKLVMQLNAPAQNAIFALDARKRQLEGG